MAASDDHDELARRFADNESNKAVDALFIVAQHDDCKWAHECRYVKDLCRATRVETGLWSAMTRVHYGPFKRTLLMYETQRGRLDRVHWLLARGAPRDARDTWGQTALIWVGCGHPNIVDSLIAHALIAHGAGVNIATNSGATPLHYASRQGHTDIVRALIAGGAGVNITDNGNWTPLDFASRRFHTEIVLALREAGGI
jgi:hypothetical protein